MMTPNDPKMQIAEIGCFASEAAPLERPASRTGFRRYSAASSFDALLATSRIADITWSVAVCWIMWPFPATR